MKKTDRDLTFRVWNNKTNKWVHGPHKIDSLDGVNLFGEMIMLGAFLQGVSIADYDQLVALQFTGLRDKNGKKIYEGDIVKVNSKFMIGFSPKGVSTFTKEVIFQDGCFGIVGANEFVCFQHIIRNKIGDDSIEVVGNAFENPELLKN